MNATETTRAIQEFSHRALMHFGEHRQRLKAIEEFSECSAALAKDICNFEAATPAERVHLHGKVIGELADVMIMVMQMTKVYGDTDVYETVQAKINRTDEFIDRQKELRRFAK